MNYLALLKAKSAEKRLGKELPKLPEAPKTPFGSYGSSEGGRISDFDDQGTVRHLDEGANEYGDFPRYEAALQQGLLVICRRCEFYKGPHANALGWCRKFDTETAPDVPFTCGAASRA